MAKDDSQLFGPIGNYEDYWLTQYDRREGGVWHSLHSVLEERQKHLDEQWTAETDSYASMIRHEYEGGGGLQGNSPELEAVREGAVRDGLRDLAWQRRLQELGHAQRGRR